MRWIILTAALLGALGSAQAASKGTLDRIKERGDGRCIGGFLSIKSWLLVLLMMAGGRLLRGSGVPMSWIGFLYVAVGVALVVGSRKPETMSSRVDLPQPE